MELVKTVLRLEFTEAFRPWLELRSLIRLFGDNPVAEIEGASLILPVPAKKRRIILQIRAITIEHEGVATIEESSRHSQGLLDVAMAETKLPSLKMIQHDAMFIEPYPPPFYELVGLLKSRYLRESPFVNAVTDVALVFDQHEGDFVKHTQIGPMEAQQMRSQFLLWPPEKLPEQFLFVNVGYRLQREVAADVGYLREFLESAAKWQAIQAENVVDDLRKFGGS